MYLENIFIGTEDIRKQLPKETSIFEEINDQWKEFLLDMKHRRSILESIPQKSIFAALLKMNTDLEKIQKSLGSLPSVS